ncbi:MAG: hypothetical protein LBU12_01935 [Deltaproteobacteria bacterium]|jgi:hypothetical protein|nr:hypothetical protein [Deltaproteobacteria bacterium]
MSRIKFGLWLFFLLTLFAAPVFAQEDPNAPLTAADLKIFKQYCAFQLKAGGEATPAELLSFVGEQGLSPERFGVIRYRVQSILIGSFELLPEEKRPPAQDVELVQADREALEAALYSGEVN